MDEFRYSWSGGVSTVPLRHDCESGLAGPLADHVRPANAGRGRSGRARCLLIARVLGDLQTIGRLGDVLHSWESISRHPGEDLLCSGRAAAVGRHYSLLGKRSTSMPLDDGAARPDPDGPRTAAFQRSSSERRRILVVQLGRLVRPERGDCIPWQSTPVAALVTARAGAEGQVKSSSQAREASPTSPFTFQLLADRDSQIAPAPLCAGRKRWSLLHKAQSSQPRDPHHPIWKLAPATSRLTPARPSIATKLLEKVTVKFIPRYTPQTTKDIPFLR